MHKDDRYLRSELRSLKKLVRFKKATNYEF